MTREVVMGWGAVAMSILVVLGFIFALLISYEAKDQANLGVLIGVVSGGFTTAVGFWLGSSASSQKKDETIAKLAPPPPPAAPPVVP